MTLDREAFSAVWHRYEPPSSGEHWLEDVLRENSIPFAAMERVGLLMRFYGSTGEINSFALTEKGAALLRRGQGVDEFVVLSGGKSGLLAELDGQQGDCSNESYSLRTRLLLESRRE
jgi:hypothetical protein